MEKESERAMRNARRVREGLGLSLNDVMRHTSLDSGHLSRWERELADMAGSRLLELLTYYRQQGAAIGMEDLLRGETEERVPELATAV